VTYGRRERENKNTWQGVEDGRKQLTINMGSCGRLSIM